MDNLTIQKIINSPVTSNCYVLYSNKNLSCVIIDPGSEYSLALFEFISIKKLVPEYIILTHHHFDHIWGVNFLVDKYGCAVICSEQCSLKIVNRKLNLSYYYNGIGFELSPADIFVEDLNYNFMWNEMNFKIYPTPGHSESCITLMYEDILFTGDALIDRVRTVTKLPGGNQQALNRTYLLFEEFLDKKKNITVYPGHGNIFNLKQINLNNRKLHE